jgi:hypothetical protein
MTVHNADVARIFDRLADLFEIDGANPFRVRAYRDAACIVGDLPHEVSALIAAGKDLSELSGIGKDLAGKDRGDRRTGHGFAGRDQAAGPRRPAGAADPRAARTEAGQELRVSCDH